MVSPCGITAHITTLSVREKRISVLGQLDALRFIFFLIHEMIVTVTVLKVRAHHKPASPLKM